MHFHHQERFLPIFHGLRFFLNFFRVPMKFLHYNESIGDKKIKISFSSIILTSYVESVQKIIFCQIKGVRGAISQKGLVNFSWYAHQIEAFFISVYPKEKFWMVEFLHSESHCGRLSLESNFARETPEVVILWRKK